MLSLRLFVGLFAFPVVMASAIGILQVLQVPVLWWFAILAIVAVVAGRYIPLPWE